MTTDSAATMTMVRNDKHPQRQSHDPVHKIFGRHYRTRGAKLHRVRRDRSTVHRVILPDEGHCNRREHAYGIAADGSPAPAAPGRVSWGAEELRSGFGGGGGVALIGARVTGVRVTPISGLSDWSGDD